MIKVGDIVKFNPPESIKQAVINFANLHLTYSYLLKPLEYIGKQGTVVLYNEYSKDDSESIQVCDDIDVKFDDGYIMKNMTVRAFEVL